MQFLFLLPAAQHSIPFNDVLESMQVDILVV